MNSAKLITIHFLCIFLGILSNASASIAVNDDKNAGYIMCKSNKIVRTIRIEKEENEKSCVTVYTKAGVDREVGRATNLSNCTRILDNIKGNLESANWKCRDVNKVSMTSSYEDSE